MARSIILERRVHATAEPERRVLEDEQLIERLLQCAAKVEKPSKCMEVKPMATAVRMKVILPHSVGIFTGSRLFKRPRIKTMGSLLQLPNDTAFTDQSSAKKLVEEIADLWESAKPIH